MRALFVSMAVLSIAGCRSLEAFEQPPDPVGPGSIPPPAVKDCSNYTYNGATFDCSTLDACDFSQDSIPMRVACCDCDPELCNPVTTEECPGVEPPPPPPPVALEEAESCMECHNGSSNNDYAGTGISNPHWVTNVAAQYLRCTQCHGGRDGLGKADSHVPRPPQLGDDAALVNNPEGYFNYLTRAGLDKFPNYTVDGTEYSAIDFIQFMNPGDMRAINEGRSCGNSGCHQGEHTEWFKYSNILTESGFYSNTFYTIGSPGNVPESEGLYTNTASDMAVRATTDPAWVYSSDPSDIGKIGRLLEVPSFSKWGDATGFYNNPIFDANTLAAQRYAANDANNYVNQVIPGSPLEKIVYESITFQCGDCHAYASGANNRYADFRSSGCTVCHMAYSLDGRSLSTDPNVPKYEPANPDAIAAPERSHIKSHTILNVAKYINTPNGMVFVSGVNDNTCVGCHQGSNRTVLQFWGVRLDQNQDVVNNFQYPANPNTFVNTAQNALMYDPALQNATFNGRNANQYLAFEDYDADNRDDTPMDIHYERGMACIDCHGSRDTHNGTKWENPVDGATVVDAPGMFSKMDQTVGVQCETCHGDSEYYADYVDCFDYEGVQQMCVTDRFGNPMRNVSIDGNGNYWLVSRLDQVRHFIPQTRDTVVDTGKRHPINNAALYSPNASYAMGRANDFGNQNDGVGPLQTNVNLVGNDFSHMDTMACDACHASWNNNCIGCHLQLQYNANPAAFFFSNQTGERIVVQVTNADFMYINPVWYFLEVNPQGTVGSGQPGMKAFYRYVDINGNLAAGLTFTDRNGNGNNPNFSGSNAFPAMSHNRIYAHSIRGRVDAANEGTRQCVECHLNVDQLANFADYPNFWTQFIVNRNYNFLVDNNVFNTQIANIGQNTHNANNNPYWVAMVAGLGTGMLLVDANGCPVNPIDANANRFFCQNVAPADQFDINNRAYDLDRVVEYTGAANSSFTKPMLNTQGVLLRSGAQDATLSGPLGTELITKLADPVFGRILDSYIDSNGNAQGDAANYIQFNY
jgi:hypothetical protein